MEKMLALGVVLSVTDMLSPALGRAGKNVKLFATLQGDIDIDDGSLEFKKGVERKIKMYVDKYILEIDGKQGVMLDAINIIAIIDGVDYMAELRNNIS